MYVGLGWPEAVQYKLTLAPSLAHCEEGEAVSEEDNVVKINKKLLLQTHMHTKRTDCKLTRNFN